MNAAFIASGIIKPITKRKTGVTLPMTKRSHYPNHRPPHLLFDNSWYFISAHIVSKQNILQYDGHKEIWITALKELSESHNVRVFAWVLLNNHYHLLVLFNNAKKLPRFINQLHGRTSHQFNIIEDCSGRKVWYSYWDSLIRGENDFWTRFNYIHYNPVKHQLVQKPEDWQYSSYRTYLEKIGAIWLADCWESYHVVEYNFE